MENSGIPVTINESNRHGLHGHYAAVGARTDLETAHRTGSAVTITIPGSPFEGDRVYLGFVQVVPDEDPRRIGELRTWTAASGPARGREVAAYAIDETRLQGAPKFAAALRKRAGAELRGYGEMRERAAAEDARLAKLDEEN